MDLSDSLDSGFSKEMGLTDRSKDFLLTTCKWTKFLAIVGFVFLGLFILMALYVGIVGASMFGLMGMGGFGAGAGFFMMIMYLFIAALYFFPTLYLYRFSTLTKQGIESGSSDVLERGFENLKSCFKFMGVFMAIIIGFYVIMFLLALM